MTQDRHKAEAPTEEERHRAERDRTTTRVSHRENCTGRSDGWHRPRVGRACCSGCGFAD